MLAGLVVGWSQIQYYFFSEISDTAARNLLLRECFKIANDHFPTGTGFGTFASHYSSVEYSPIYEKYGLSTVYGLTKNNPVFISDSFWPMVIGQNGYVGLVLFCLAIIELFKEIQKLAEIDKDCYMATSFSLAYICVASLAESAFVAPITMPMAIVFGLAFNKKDKAMKVLDKFK